MTINRVKGRFGIPVARTVAVRDPNKALDPVQLWGQPFSLEPAKEIVGVDPWGLLVPAEAIEDEVPLFAVMNAQSFPDETKFTLHFVPEGGAGSVQISRVYFGPDPLMVFDLPSAWFQPAIGKRIALHYEVELPDGTHLSGGGIEFRVTPYLEVAPILFEGLGIGQPLQPGRFPDGLVAIFQHVPQLQPYHMPKYQFSIIGIKDGFEHAQVNTFSISGLEEGVVKLTIDPSLYSGRYEDGYTDVRVMSSLIVDTLPPPNTKWGAYFLLGRMEVFPG